MSVQMGITCPVAESTTPDRDVLVGPSGCFARRYQTMTTADLGAASTNPAASALVRVPFPAPGPGAQ